MPAFQSKPLQPSRLNRTLKNYPLLFGIPFVAIMVGASYAMTTFTQTRYDLHDKRVRQVSKEEALGLEKNRKKFDIREEYFRLSSQPEEDWENKRIERPNGVAQWGEAPDKLPAKDVFRPKSS